MKVKFNVTEKSLNKALGKENKQILNQVLLGKSGQKSLKVNDIIFSILSIIVGVMLIGIMSPYVDSITINVMKFGFLLIIIGAIYIIFFKEKLSLKYLEKERMKFIKERNKDILLATNNYEKENFSVDGIIEIKGDFIEIDFGGLKKVYGIDSIKSIEMEYETLILEFKTRKYFIKKSDFKSEKDIKTLKDLLKEKREKSVYEIDEKISEEINLKDYKISPIKEINPKVFIENLFKVYTGKETVLRSIGFIGLAITLIGTGILQSEVLKSIIFVVITIITIKIMQNKKGNVTFFHNSKGKRKFYSDLGFKSIRIYIGEKNNYIFSGDDITIVQKKNMEIKKDENKIIVNLFNKEFLVANKNVSEDKIILKMEKRINVGEELVVNLKEGRKIFKRVYRNKRLKIFVAVWCILILIFGNTDIKRVEGIALVLFGYIVFYLNGIRLEKKLSKLYKKINLDKEKSKDEIINIEIFQKKLIVWNSKYLKSIYDVNKISIEDEQIKFGAFAVPKENFSNEEIEVLKNINKDEKRELENKGLEVKVRENNKEREKILKSYECIPEGVVTGGCIGVIIACIGVTVSIGVIGIGLLIGSLIVYRITIKTMRNEVIKGILSNTGGYIRNDKLYVELKDVLRRYDLNYLDVEFTEKEILLKKDNEVILFIENTEDANLYFKMRKI
ncbi:MAG: hypothetical protein ACRDDY_04580 [Clostridium sp.]|uniref:hypothetical protein n=1 Tax=Clostridium sp. TaxID=1506 RepID=UPI003EE7A88A